jgi:hypothetical protein
MIPRTHLSRGGSLISAALTNFCGERQRRSSRRFLPRTQQRQSESAIGERRRVQDVVQKRSCLSEERDRMNTANLQLEGVHAVLAALLMALRDKAVLSDAEIDLMLTEVERGITDAKRSAEIRTANVEAMCFPARFLKQALRSSSQGQRSSFAQIVALIKQPPAE